MKMRIARWAMVGFLLTCALAACRASSGRDTIGPTVSPFGSVSPSGAQPRVRIVITGGNRAYALGHRIYITDNGFAPLHLIAGINRPVVFVNASSRTQGVEFINYGSTVESGPIPPGGTWTFRPTVAVSVIYRSTAPPHSIGYLQLQLVQPVST